MKGATLVAAFVVMCLGSAGRANAQPLISSPVGGTLGLDAGAALTLAWTTVPNATAYVVELSENPSFQPLLPLKDPQVSAQATRSGPPR